MTNHQARMTNEFPMSNDQRMAWPFGIGHFLAILVWSLVIPTYSSAGVFYPDGATTLHFAFEGSPNGDRPIIRPPAFYRADDGFGFVDSPTLVGTSRGVTAPKYFRFDVNVPPGNYDVSIVFGGTQEESISTVKAEGHRPMLLDVHSSRQQTVRGFTVNVRQGSVGKENVDNPLDIDGRLNLEFMGTNPSMMKLDVKPNEKAVTVYLVGDSSVADLNGPNAGWGQMLPMLFKQGEVAVANHSTPNATARSFLDEQRLEIIATTLKAGDYLFVQFGGEFEGVRDAATFKKQLQVYVEEARKHQATLVLVSAPSLAGLISHGTVAPSKALQWLREFAQEDKVPLIDLHAASLTLFEKVGSEKAIQTMVIGNGNNVPSSYGAYELAKLVAQGIQEQKLDLASHLVGDIATNPNPTQFPASLGYVYFLEGKQ